MNYIEIHSFVWKPNQEGLVFETDDYNEEIKTVIEVGARRWAVIKTISRLKESFGQA